MGTGAITGYFDVAQITLYAFWIFFAGLIIYLHRENKREGYPLENDRSARVTVQGWPPIPKSKTYLLADGRSVTIPPAGKPAPQADIAATPIGSWPGAPLEPTGNPMTAGVGPGSYNQREDMPDVTFEGSTRLAPLRVATDYGVASQDPDPRGMAVVGADGVVAGRVRDIWVDRSEALFRYYEVALPNAARGPQVLLPVNFARVTGGRVMVKSILGKHFADVPRTRNPDVVTRLEEEKIMAYYGAGTLYATPSRQQPLF